MLREKIQDHLAADGRRLVQPCDEPKVGQAVFECEPISAMDLNRLVERLKRGVGGGKFRDVRGFSRFRRSEIIELRRSRRHQTRPLDCHIGFGERMSDALMGTDRDVPDFPFGSVPRGLLQREARDAIVNRRSADALRIEPGEDLAKALAFAADQCALIEPDLVEKDGELRFGNLKRGIDLRRGNALGIGRDK